MRHIEFCKIIFDEYLLYILKYQINYYFEIILWSKLKYAKYFVKYLTSDE